MKLLFERARAELGARQAVQLIVRVTGPVRKITRGRFAVMRLLVIVPRVLDVGKLAHRAVRQDDWQRELGHETLHHPANPP